ncbi:hypothetical protein OPV22_015353 [Ensete ventricosum]|uniref:Uncharacterized protein n=1 Tax=Ensete ventricosum TaxID=4639 RepID=A0AAV8RDG2_ENSVE|nr:hypothetical protein OPV22_015353 [Ensete ventricosum]
MLEYLKEMPEIGTQLRFDISSLLGALFFTWIIELHFPVILTYLFNDMKSDAAVTGYIYVFGSGLLGPYLLQFFIQDTSFPRAWIIVMELIPGFSLYRGLYELSQYSIEGDQMGTSGMQWQDLNDRQNGMKDVLIIIDNDPKFLLKWRVLMFLRNVKPNMQFENYLLLYLMVNVLACLALMVLEKLRLSIWHHKDNSSILQAKLLRMIGLITPSSGTAYVQGMDIRTNMDQIYTSMGVCPQHDLLWETLTGREHLLFYGPLKNLKGAALLQAVEESLKSILRLSTWMSQRPGNHTHNTLNGGSRGFMCRLGNFVDGGFQCIGNAKELKARYGGSYVFTMTTSENEEEEVQNLVRRLSPNANKIYHISGTQKFELPKQEVRISDVFRAV